MTLEEYAKKVTKLLERYIDDVQILASENGQESILIVSDGVILDLQKLKIKLE